MTGQAVNDITATVEVLLEKEELLIVNAVAKTMKRYHEDPSARNLRDMEAAKQAMKKKQANKPPKPDAHEKTLKKGYDKAKKAADKSPTVKRLKDLAEAEALLKDYRAQRLAAVDPSSVRLANHTEVLEYLKDEGWKIEKSKLYADWKKIDLEKDGTCTRAAADRYAKLTLEKLDGSDQENDLEGKAELDARLKRAQAEKIERENNKENGLLILKSEAEQKHTAKLALFLTAVDNLIYGGPVEDAVHIVKGDMKKIKEFQVHLKKSFTGILADYAKAPTFSIPKKTLKEAEEFKLDG